MLQILTGYAVAQLVETLDYKPESRGFNPACACDNRNRTMGPTGPLTEMSTGNIPCGQTALPPSYADCLEILGASNFCSTKGLSRPVKG